MSPALRRLRQRSVEFCMEVVIVHRAYVLPNDKRCRLPIDLEAREFLGERTSGLIRHQDSRERDPLIRRRGRKRLSHLNDSTSYSSVKIVVSADIEIQMRAPHMASMRRETSPVDVADVVHLQRDGIRPLHRECVARRQ